MYTILTPRVVLKGDGMKKINRKKSAKHIAKLVKGTGLSLNQFAKQLGVATSVVSAYLGRAGKRPLSIPSVPAALGMMDIAKKHGIDLTL